MKMQRRALTMLGVTAALAASVAGGSVAVGATSLSLSASMTPAQVATPKNRPWVVPAAVKNAKGVFSGRLAADGRTLTWKLAYAKVPGQVIADIHIGKPGKFGAFLGRLCSECKSGQQGRVKLKRNYAQQFKLKNTWVTLITPKYPNGIVRGQITAK